MDRIRFALWFGLLASVWISYTTWVTEQQPETPPAAAATGGGGAAGADGAGADSVPAVPGGDAGVPDLPAPDTPGATNADVRDPDTGAPTGDTVAPNRLVRVETDVLDLVIDLEGGDIVRADLLDYPVEKSDPDTLVRLLDYGVATRWVFETGFAGGAGASSPNHTQRFRADEAVYRLGERDDELTVRLDWIGDGSGLEASKIYRFRRGQYGIDLDLVVRNRGSEAWAGAPYAQMIRVHNPVARSYLSVDTYSFTGPVLYNPDGDGYQKLDFDDLSPTCESEAVSRGWYAGIQHHFLAAVVPPSDQAANLCAYVDGAAYRLRALGPVQTVSAGAETRYPVQLFVGPKVQDQLTVVADKLELAVDYGLLSFLSRPLFLVLDFIHGWVHNWGWSIIITTILIKLLFYKLTATSGRSMAKMRKLAPRMKALQEKYKDDRQALGQATMELYKKEKVNPAAGCLPILIQMPFFFAFYWVLVESVEMRQAPFMLWIDDLSVRDPFFILPAVMVGAMLLQTRLNPTPPDPVQARVMQIMPVVFGALFALFPAGLVLYWLTNTVISIAQQWRINQLVARES